MGDRILDLPTDQVPPTQAETQAVMLLFPPQQSTPTTTMETNLKIPNTPFSRKWWWPYSSKDSKRIFILLLILGFCSHSYMDHWYRKVWQICRIPVSAYSFHYFQFVVYFLLVMFLFRFF